MSKTGPSTNLRCNEQIRLSPVRVIDANGGQVGVIDTFEALRQAREQGLDLVEVAPNERPPVCRIMDYGKFKYQQKKNLRRHHEQQLKEIRLRPKTDEHDRQIKINRALKFLAKGDKVQFSMVFRGRERAHREIGFDFFNKLIAQLGAMVKIERPPAMDGRQMLMVVSPVKAVIDKAIASGQLKIGKLDEVEHEDDADVDVDVDGGEPSPELPAASANPAERESAD